MLSVGVFSNLIFVSSPANNPIGQKVTLPSAQLSAYALNFTGTMPFSPGTNI